MIGAITWQIPFGIVLLAFGVFFLAGNWACLLAGRSMVPPVGGLLAFIGLLLVGVPYYWAWIGLVSDPGMFLVAVLPWLAYELLSWSRYCRLRQFVSTSDDKTVTISLFKRSNASILFEYRKPTKDTEAPHCISRSLVGNWTTADKDIRLTCFPDWQEATLIETGNRYEASEQGEDRSSDSDVSIDGMLFVEKSDTNDAS